MKLTVNGVEREIETPPLTPLLHVLREELGITSPKAGCQQGGCGACTVLVDGEPRRACLLPVAALNGAEITTLEGLGTPERLVADPGGVPRALRRPVRLLHAGHRARGARRYIERGGTADAEAIQEALAGHVCRCTGYVEDHRRRGGRARRRDRPRARLPRPSDESVAGGAGMKAVGARLPRYDGVAHVTGRTMYVDDVRVPGTLWAKALRSPRPPRRRSRGSTRRRPRR